MEKGSKEGRSEKNRGEEEEVKEKAKVKSLTESHYMKKYKLE